MTSARPTRTPRGGTSSRESALAVPAALAVGVVLLQIAYPLATGAARDTLTVATVVVFFAASVSHAWLQRGARFASWLVVSVCGVGLGVEALGVRTGFPFGTYSYADSLGPKVADVAVVIPLAWTMMAYPALLVGRRLAGRPLPGIAIAAVALASWDLFLDPQMVQAGHWTWAAEGVYAGIPLTNYAGWVLTATVMMALLWPALAAAPATRDDRVPAALYLWTWGGSVVAHLVFLGNPVVALVGGVGMGLVAVPFAWSLRRSPGASA